AEWTALLEGTDACVAPVLDLAEAFEHPHLAARKTFIEVEGVIQPAPAPRFSRTPAATPVPPIATNSTSAANALRGWLPDDAIGRFAAARVFE
ncbi:MAG: CoA transferase, partial [Betaproteobacteria bacterium]